MELDISFMADCLGAFVASRPDSSQVSLRLMNTSLGIRLKLDIYQETSQVRLHIDRTGRGQPTYVGTVELDEIRSMSIDSVQGRVCFEGERATLVVTNRATFRLNG